MLNITFIFYTLQSGVKNKVLNSFLIRIHTVGFVLFILRRVWTDVALFNFQCNNNGVRMIIILILFKAPGSSVQYSRGGGGRR